ncbi:hypothetical protein D3C76_1616750 [compost metagenome]
MKLAGAGHGQPLVGGDVTEHFSGNDNFSCFDSGVCSSLFTDCNRTLTLDFTAEVSFNPQICITLHLALQIAAAADQRIG